MRYYTIAAETSSRRGSVDRFTEVEDKLYLWIDSVEQNLSVPPFLAILKAKKIAEELLIWHNDFKASWQWFCRFRERRGIQQLFLHGEGAEVDRENLDLVAALDKLYAIISKYDLENVYNMDESGLFFRLLLKYTLLMPFEDVSSTRGKKKDKERVSLVVCANATAINNKVLEVEDQLLCPDVQVQARNYYNELRNSFELFQQKLRQVILDAERKREQNMHQLTIHDLFKL